ncbi:MAG: Zn-binding domain-containing protein [Mycobacteriales bacterium]
MAELRRCGTHRGRDRGHAASRGRTRRRACGHRALPLFATCDRWDVGGVSTPWHRQTGRTSIFVYDGYPGGAGFAERAYEAGPEWLAASASAIACCRCVDGCPSCIQSPKCPHGNEPLDKVAALGLLNVALRELGSTGGAMASACSQRRAAPRWPRLGAG